MLDNWFLTEEFTEQNTLKIKRDIHFSKGQRSKGQAM